jgi:oxygen-independent coproporphyrinogen-3 oxidase
VSFDLIYARPGQTAEAWQNELEGALAFGTEHAVAYQLTIEPGTAYATLASQGKLKVPEEDAAAELYELTQLVCEHAGLSAYEVSNHSRDGAASRHNLNLLEIWDYAVSGPGAHGRLINFRTAFWRPVPNACRKSGWNPWSGKRGALRSPMSLFSMPPASIF